MNHSHVWGYPTKAKPYRSNESKLDSRVVGCYFIGYFERFRGYKFHDPTTKSIFETKNVQFFEDVQFEVEVVRNLVFEEKYINIFTGVIDLI